jgi:hypothetical protein
MAKIIVKDTESKGYIIQILTPTFKRGLFNCIEFDIIKQAKNRE